MNPYSLLTPLLTTVLLASTGLVVVDEVIEHGYTIPDISEKYWDYETQFLDEDDLDKFTGKWTGEYFPDQMTIEYEDGTIDYCGNASLNTYVSENNVRGTAIVTWNNIPDEGVVKAHYEMRGELDTNGDTNGTFGISFELSMVLNDPSAVYSLLSKGYSVMPNASFTGNFGNNTADILVSVDENGAEGCGGYMVLEKEELPSSDSIIQDIPGVDPYVGLLTGEPFESESNPDEETIETAIQVGTIGSVASARQISKLRSKPRPKEEVITEKNVEDLVEKEISSSDSIPDEVKDEDYDLNDEDNLSDDEDIYDDIDEEVKPKDESWLSKAGGWLLDKTEKIANWVSDKASGIGSLSASGVKKAGEIAEKGAEIAKERKKNRIKDTDNLEDISTDQMEDNWGYWRKKGVLASVVKLIKDNSSVSMGAAFGTLGGIMGGAAGAILSFKTGGVLAPKFVLGGMSAGGMIGSAIGSTLSSMFP